LKWVAESFTLSRAKHIIWRTSFNAHEHILWATIHLVLLWNWHAVFLIPSPLIYLSYAQACFLRYPFALLVAPGWIGLEFKSEGLFLVRVLLRSWLWLFFLFVHFWGTLRLIFSIIIFKCLFLIYFLFPFFIRIWEERLWYTKEHFRELVLSVLILLLLQILLMRRLSISDVSKSTHFCWRFTRSCLTLCLIFAF